MDSRSRIERSAVSLNPKGTRFSRSSPIRQYPPGSGRRTDRFSASSIWLKHRSSQCCSVWKFDRLARNLLFSVTTVNDLKEWYDVVLRSVAEPIDTATPMGGIIFALLASFAAEERRVITGWTLAGKKEKASRGGFAGGAAPLGYKRDLRGG